MKDPKLASRKTIVRTHAVCPLWPRTQIVVQQCMSILTLAARAKPQQIRVVLSLSRCHAALGTGNHFQSPTVDSAVECSQPSLLAQKRARISLEFAGISTLGWRASASFAPSLKNPRAHDACAPRSPVSAETRRAVPPRPAECSSRLSGEGRAEVGRLFRLAEANSMGCM